MKRKDYVRPTMKVVKLQHRGILMASGEGRNATVKDYDWNTEVPE
jgi:hypothetical protein